MRGFFVALVMGLLAWSPVQAGQVYDGTLPTQLLPKAPAWTALTPDGHTANSAPLPIVFFLHGAGGSNGALKVFRHVIERAWKQGTLPPCVVVMLRAEKSYYMDYRDGSEKWETFYVQEFMPAMRQLLNGSQLPTQTALIGNSMGGYGALKIAFKYPHLFAAVAALSPAVESVSNFDQLTRRDNFRRHLYPKHFGQPIDKAYWQQNSPLFLAQTQGAKLRDSGLGIYIEVGDDDVFYLHHGAEAIHRALWDQEVSHEYRVVQQADHSGPVMGMLYGDAFGYIGRVFNPPQWKSDRVRNARQTIRGPEAPRRRSKRD